MTFALRNLDCAVDEMAHELRKELELFSYGVFRGAFIDGDELYPGAGIKSKYHIQICVRNKSCKKKYLQLPSDCFTDLQNDPVQPVLPAKGASLPWPVLKESSQRSAHS